MSDERREILRMLADKVITVDDAERLLLALGEGENRGPKEGPRRSSTADGSAKAGGPFGVRLDELGALIGNIGEMVGERIQDALGRVSFDIEPGEDEDEAARNLTDLPVIDGKFAVPSGAELDIRMVAAVGEVGAGRLELVAGEGEEGQVRLARPDLVKVQSGEGLVRIECRDRSLAVDIPATVSRVRARALVGDIRADHLPCELKVRTAAGQIELIGVEKDFRARCLGGGIRIQVPAAFRGRGQANATGGVIVVEVDEGVEAELSANCLGGNVKVDPEVGRIKSSRGLGHQKVQAQIGPEGAGARLDLKAMGGEIRVSRSGADQSGQVEPVATDQRRRW